MKLKCVITAWSELRVLLFLAPKTGKQMKTTVLQGRDFLNFVENTQSFGEHASKLLVELIVLKDAPMMILLYNAGFIQNDFLFCVDTWQFSSLI